ncbi:MAG TPA: ABC transporter ATP-binding protein, partial [Microbacterium sp.]|uniref:ABC transporter ATP-binding protein n=1 Tax=Microbacterium sp. TaxID=51671 RepID=UPI002D0F7F53
MSDLRVEFAVRSQRKKVRLRAVDGVSLTVAPGEILGVVGESGCGKSTLARTIAGLTAPTAGSINLEGASMSGKRSIDDTRAIQMIFQDPGASLNPRITVGSVLTEVLMTHQLVERSTARARVDELLHLVGLPERAYDALPRQLSGGQRQRVGIARALAVEPRLLVADEAIAALDVSVQAAILNLFARLRSRLGLSMIFISHDLGAVRSLCDRVAVMYLGQIVEIAPVEELYQNPGHPYTRALIAANPSLDNTAAIAPPLKGEPPSPINVPTGCRFHPRCPLATETCRTGVPPVRERPDHKTSCHRAWEPAP